MRNFGFLIQRLVMVLQNSLALGSDVCDYGRMVQHPLLSFTSPGFRPKSHKLLALPFVSKLGRGNLLAQNS